MSILMEFAMFPRDKGANVGERGDRVVAMVRDSGFGYRLTPMGTVTETAIMAETLEILRKAHETLAPDMEWIYLSAEWDIRKGRTGGLDGKIDSIRSRVGDAGT